MTNTNASKITIAALKPDNRGQPYAVSFEGKIIIAKSHVPAHDACRHLVTLGLSGPMEVWATEEHFPRMRFKDIESAAKWTVKEGQTHGPRFAPYVPFDREALFDRVDETAEAEAA